MADYQMWCDRYGDHYATDEQRREGYRDYRANLVEVQTVFGTGIR